MASKRWSSPPIKPMIRRRQQRPDIPYRQGKARRDHCRHPRLPRTWAARPGRNDLDRKLRTALDAARRRKNCRIRYSTPSSTRGKRRSSSRRVRPGMITIATNMAGRGTDIVLGGSIEKQISDDSRRRIALEEADKEARIGRPARRVADGAQPGGGLWRPAYHRLRAPRITPHRQSTARPVRPPGRPRLLAFLSGAG